MDINKKQEDIIAVCRRNILQKILNIRWPEKLSSGALHERTKVSSWSKIVKKRTLPWHGHHLRLPAETPAKKALREAQKSSKKRGGGRKQIWLKLITKDLEKVKVTVVVSGGGQFERNYNVTSYHEQLATNRQHWQMVVNSAMC